MKLKITGVNDVLGLKKFWWIDDDNQKILSRILSVQEDSFVVDTNYKELKEIVQRGITSAPTPDSVLFWIDDFSNNTILGELGANHFTGLDYSQKIPFAKNVPIDEVSENDEAIDASVTFTKQAHEPKRFSAFVNISQFVSIQTNREMESYLQRNISKAIAAKVEAKLLAALVADVDINIVADGLSHDGLNSMEAAINQVNDVQLKSGYICNPANKGLLKKLEAAGGSLLWKDGKLNDERILSSKSMTSGSLLYGDWSQAFILQYDKIQLIRDIYTLAKSGFVVMVVNGWYSYSYTDPKSFALIADITV